MKANLVRIPVTCEVKMKWTTRAYETQIALGGESYPIESQTTNSTDECVETLVIGSSPKQLISQRFRVSDRIRQMSQNTYDGFFDRFGTV